MQKCPHCGLENPETAEHCDCGHNFASGRVDRTPSILGARNDKVLKNPIVWAVCAFYGLAIVSFALYHLGFCSPDSMLMGPNADDTKVFHHGFWGYVHGTVFTGIRKNSWQAGTSLTNLLTNRGFSSDMAYRLDFTNPSLFTLVTVGLLVWWRIHRRKSKPTIDA